MDPNTNRWAPHLATGAVLALAAVLAHGGPAGARGPLTDEPEPIRLEIDAKTKLPKGPVAEPRGPLLDPRDLPAILEPRFEVIRGLEGFESSLTALLTRSLGFVVEVEQLEPRYHPHAHALRDNWNEEIGAALTRLDPEAPDAWACAALYQDTGRHLSEDRTTIAIVAAPRIALVPLERAELDELLALELRIATLGPEMSADDAERLFEIAEAADADSIRDSWFAHAKSQLLFLATGVWKEDFVADNPFKLSTDQFFERCRRALFNGLVRPRLPTLDETQDEDDLYFFEGWAVVRLVPKAQKGADEDVSWAAPSELVDYNARTGRPLLLVEVVAMARYRSTTKLKKIEISMVVGGEERELYDGKWPFP